MDRVIYDLCAGTGAWSQPYQDAGYDVRRVDIKDGQDVRLLEKPGGDVHGVLAAPPCTHLAVSGARWWEEKGEEPLIENLSIVDACLRFIMVTDPEWWVLENPIGRLVHYLGKPQLYFDPCEFGDPWTKRTCLWGDFNIPERDYVDPTEGSKLHKLPPTEDRAELRSITPPGFAKAFFKANP